MIIGVVVLVVVVAVALTLVLRTGQHEAEHTTTTTLKPTQTQATTTTTSTVKTTTSTPAQATSTITLSTASLTTSQTTQPKPVESEMSFELKCNQGSTNEAVRAYKETKNYCWGWLGTHTYNWQTNLPVDKISGEVKIGPSEGGRGGTLYVEISRDGGSYTKVWSRNVKASDTVRFTIPLNGENIRAIRVRVSPAPMSSNWISVDYSDINVTLKERAGVIEHNCHEGVHLEAKKAYEASRDYCWGWLETHTYDIGVEKKLEYAVIYVKLGPTSVPGATSGVVDIMVSRDGENWEKIGSANIIGGGPIKVLAMKGLDRDFRYIRIEASNETPGHFIDYSAIVLAVKD